MLWLRYSAGCAAPPRQACRFRHVASRETERGDREPGARHLIRACVVDREHARTPAVVNPVLPDRAALKLWPMSEVSRKGTSISNTLSEKVSFTEKPLPPTCKLALRNVTSPASLSIRASMVCRTTVS